MNGQVYYYILWKCTQSYTSKHVCAPKVEMEDYSHISKIEILLPIPYV